MFNGLHRQLCFQYYDVNAGVDCFIQNRWSLHPFAFVIDNLTIMLPHAAVPSLATVCQLYNFLPLRVNALLADISLMISLVPCNMKTTL